MNSRRQLNADDKTQDDQWREADVQLRAGDLADRRRQRQIEFWTLLGTLAGLALTLLVAYLTAKSAIDAASVAANSATAVTSQKWQQELQDDCRKALHAAVVEYVGALAKAFHRAQEVTSGESLLGIHLTPKQYLDYVANQRKNFADVDMAAAKLFLENPAVVAKLEVDYRKLVAADDSINAIFQDKDGKVDRSAEVWDRLNHSLASFQFVTTLKTIQPELLRPIAPLGRSSPTAAAACHS